MKKIAIINGPNLNLTGRREPEVYGSTTFEQYLHQLRNAHPEVQITYHQSNVEGQLIVNLGGYSHTSVALRDALLAVPAPKIEVHLSNIFAREDYRHHSYISSACRGLVCGLGLQGYELALLNLLA